MGSMTTATAPAMRDEAERLLRELAGPDARLREDQWTAIEALVVQRKRALVVQRTGWGKSMPASQPMISTSFWSAPSA